MEEDEASRTEQRQRLLTLEAKFKLMEESLLPSMAARMKTLERNNPLESRLRRLEQTCTCGSSKTTTYNIATSSSYSIRNNPLTNIMMYFLVSLVSLVRCWSISSKSNNDNDNKKVTAVGQKASRSATNIPNEEAVIIVDGTRSTTTGSPSKTAVTMTNNTAINTVQSQSATDLAMSNSESVGLEEEKEDEENLKEDSSTRAISSSVEEQQPPEQGNGQRREGKPPPPGYTFVTQAGLDGYSESLGLIEVDDIEDCCSSGKKTTATSTSNKPLTDRVKIRILHTEAVQRGLDNYDDPATGYEVFTAHHLKTRDCCGSSCRHCPWGHCNVPGRKQKKVDGNQRATPVRMEQQSTAIANASSAVEHDTVVTAPPKSRLYTRKGDSGWGTLYNNVSILKSDPIYEAIGTVDELSSTVGFAAQMLAPTPSHDDLAGSRILPQQLQAHAQLATQLETIQAWLLDIGSCLCMPRTSSKTSANARKLQRTRGVRHEDVVTLEGWIDAADAQLGRLQNFILPGGSPGAAALHIARSVCRRAERHTWPLLMTDHGEEVLGIFLNRLSDFFFVAARLEASTDRSGGSGGGGTEQKYKIEYRVDRWQRQVVKMSA